MQNPFDPGYYGTDELRTFGFAHVGDNVRIAKTCKIVGLANISIGDHSRIDDFSTLIAASGNITIGNRVHVHSYCQIGGRGGVEIEDFAAIASACLIYSASDDFGGRVMVGGAVPTCRTRPKIAPIRMGRHSALLARCTALPGVIMGEGAVAGAHTVLKDSVPEWTFAVGERRAPRSRRLLTLEALADVAEKLDA